MKIIPIECKTVMIMIIGYIILICPVKDMALVEILIKSHPLVMARATLIVVFLEELHFIHMPLGIKTILPQV